VWKLKSDKKSKILPILTIFISGLLVFGLPLSSFSEEATQDPLGALVPVQPVEVEKPTPEKEPEPEPEPVPSITVPGGPLSLPPQAQGQAKGLGKRADLPVERPEEFILPVPPVPGEVVEFEPPGKPFTPKEIAELEANIPQELYDDQDQLISITYPDGSQTLYHYEADYSVVVDLDSDGSFVSGTMNYDNGLAVDITDVLNDTAAVVEGDLVFKKGMLDGVNDAVTDLVDRLGVIPEELSLSSIGSQTWPDGCVGWAVQGMSCTKALVTGYLAVFEINGISFEYHAGRLDPNMVAILEEVEGIEPWEEKFMAIEELVALLPELPEPVKRLWVWEPEISEPVKK